MITNGVHRTGRAAAMAGALALVVTGCGSGDAGEAPDDGRIPVVASTDAWGSVLKAVGGDKVSVTSTVESSDGDPHSYESTARDGLAFSEAELVVYNGGGYDEFASQLAREASDAPVLNAVELSGHEGSDEHAEEPDPHKAEAHADEGTSEDTEHGHGHGGANEHVWYDFATVEAVADGAAKELGKIRPDEAATFEANAEKFTKALDDVEAKLSAIGEDNPGAKVIATEPVSHYLIEGAGLTDVTPEDFRDAIENETDVPVAVQDTVLRLVKSGDLAAVVNNPQTATPVTEELVEAAKQSGVPVVDVTETLPEGEDDYLGWIESQVDALDAAVNR
ncbi:MAG: metal ABC transporter substrate-binding protein [Actinophytocola sp.]|nr:metal ABC transporter substrate-binding protein [Actinophytocola sp.]